MGALGDNLREGDVILSNHPCAGGSHLPDLTVITPVSAHLLALLMYQLFNDLTSTYENQECVGSVTGFKAILRGMVTRGSWKL